MSAGGARIEEIFETRAKELLILSWPAKTRRHGDAHNSQPGQFLRELPQANLHWQGEDPKADKEVTRETAGSHLAKIKATLAGN